MGEALKIARAQVEHHQRELLAWMRRQAWLEEMGPENSESRTEPEEKSAPLVTPEEQAMLLRPEPEKTGAGRKKNIPPEKFQAGFEAGKNDRQIATELGVTPTTVNYWRKKLAAEAAKPRLRTRKGALTRAGMDEKRREEQQSRLEQFTESVTVENGVKVTRLKRGFARGAVPMVNFGEGVKA